MFDSKRLKSASCKIWRMIDTARHHSGIRKKELAAIAGVHYNTVMNDSKHPEQIPLWRMYIYCDAVGISLDSMANSMYSQVMKALLE